MFIFVKFAQRKEESVARFVFSSSFAYLEAIFL